MGRPKKIVKTDEDKYAPYRIVENNGKFIVYHGNSVRQVFASKEPADKYLELIKA